MPTIRQLTPEEQEYARQQGLDPSQLTVTMPDVTPEKTSSLPALARSAGSAVLPTVASGLGAGIATGALAGTSVGPVGTLIGGLGGGLLAGMGAGALQNAVMPDTWKQKLAQDASEHPVASEVGQIITLPLGGFSPSKDVLEAGQYGINKLLGTTARNVGKQALINSATGAGLGAIQEGVVEKLRGEDLSASDIAKQALIGTVFNRANRLGQAYGFAPHTTRPIDKPSQEFIHGAPEEPVIKAPDVRQQEGQVVSPDTESRFAGIAKDLQQPNLTGIEPKVEAPKEKPKPKGNYRVQTPTIEDITSTLKDSGYTGALTPELTETYRSLLAEHGLPLEQREMADRGLYEGNKIAISNKPGSTPSVETIPHELSHHVWSTLPEEVKQSFSEKSQADIDRINAERVKYNAENPDKQLRQIDPEEYFASEMGGKAALRAAEGGNAGVMNWLRDLRSQLKTKYGSAEVGDIYRSALVDLMNGKTPLEVPTGVAPAEVKQQQEGEGIPGPELTREQKLEARKAADKARREAQKQELQQLREAVAAKEGRTVSTTEGQRQVTAPEQRKQITNVTPRFVQHVESRMKLMLNGMKKSVAGLKNLPAADMEDILSEAKIKLFREGIDSDKFNKTLERRTREALDNAVDAHKQRAEVPISEDVERKLTNTPEERATGKQHISEYFREEEPEYKGGQIIGQATGPEKLTLPIEFEGSGDRSKQQWQSRMPLVEKNVYGERQLIAPEKRERLETAKKIIRQTPETSLVDTEKLLTGVEGKKEVKSQEQEDYEKMLEKYPSNEGVKFTPREEGGGLSAEELQKMQASKIRKQEAGEGVTVSQKYNYLRTKPELDVARDKAGPEGKPVADALQDFHPRRDYFYGRYASKPLEELGKLTPVDKQKLLNVMYREDVEGKFLRNLLSSKQTKAYDAIRNSLRQKQLEQAADNQMVRGIDNEGQSYTRLPKVNPFYMPSMMRPEVLEKLVEHQGNYKDIRANLVKYWIKMGATPEAAQKRLKALVESADSKQGNATRFGSDRIVEGLGLPPEYRLNDASKLMDRYFNKVATDRAWFQTMEKDPTIAKLLNNNEVSHPFHDIVERIQGERFDKSEATIKGLNRVFTSALLGPLTNIHIGMSTLFNPMQYVKGSELASTYSNALSHLSQAREQTLRNGYKRGDFNTIKDIYDGTNTFTQKLAGLSSLIGKVSGREWTDAASKTFAQAISNEIVPRRMADARAGDKYSQKMMLQLDSQWTPDKRYTPEQLSQLASTMAGFIHGAHDARSLPGWMNKETVLKPFFSLMSWSVAQTNQWMKHVWEPAMKGNIQPLLMSALGAAVGGYVIQQLRQAVSDKKSAIPSLQEIAQSSRGMKGNIPLLAYNFMQMASFTGFAGIGSVLGKDLFDMAYKNLPQGSTFPLDEVAGSLGETVAHATSAWMQTPTAESLFEIFPRAMIDLVKENVQSARIANNWAADKGFSTKEENYKYDTSSKVNSLRRYKMTEGQPYDEQSLLANNPYLNIPQKQYKHEQDLASAQKDLPRLLEIALQRSGGNPEILQEQWRSLKQNSYQTMPSIEHSPVQFQQYYQYLVRTQGKEKADQMVSSYMQHNLVNKIKASLVP